MTRPTSIGGRARYWKATAAWTSVLVVLIGGPALGIKLGRRAIHANRVSSVALESRRLDLADELADLQTSLAPLQRDHAKQMNARATLQAHKLYLDQCSEFLVHMGMLADSSASLTGTIRLVPADLAHREFSLSAASGLTEREIANLLEPLMLSDRLVLADAALEHVREEASDWTNWVDGGAILDGAGLALRYGLPAVKGLKSARTLARATRAGGAARSAAGMASAAAEALGQDLEKDLALAESVLDRLASRISRLANEPERLRSQVGAFEIQLRRAHKTCGHQRQRVNQELVRIASRIDDIAADLKLAVVEERAAKKLITPLESRKQSLLEALRHVESQLRAM